MNLTTIPCPECGGHKTAVARIAGFRTCDECGKLFPGPRDAEGKPTGVVAVEAEPTGAAVEAPDDFEPMIGWRAWAVPADGPMPRLYSVTHSSHYWSPREPMVATCDRGGGRTAAKRAKNAHEVPDEECSCGLYSAKTRAHLSGMGYHRYDADTGMFHVMGTVSLWGKVIEGTQGWRAEIGYPRELFVPFEAWRLAKPLAAAYGVPVKLNNILAK